MPMTTEKIKELREIVKKNPKVLDSLHPFEKMVVMELFKGLDNREKADRPSPS